MCLYILFQGDLASDSFKGVEGQARPVNSPSTRQVDSFPVPCGFNLSSRKSDQEMPSNKERDLLSWLKRTL